MPGRSVLEILNDVRTLAGDIEVGAGGDSVKELASRLLFDVGSIDFSERFDVLAEGAGITSYKPRKPVTDSEVRRNSLILAIWNHLNEVANGRSASDIPAKLTSAADRLAKLREMLAEVGSEPGTPTALSDKQQEILVALFEMNSFDSDNRKNTQEIADRSEGKGAASESYKQPVSALVDAGLLESKKGRGGGLWLTPAGRERATRLTRKV